MFLPALYVAVARYHYFWSDILPRLYWHSAKSASKIDAMRKDVNRKDKNFLKAEGVSYKASYNYICGETPI